MTLLLSLAGYRSPLALELEALMECPANRDAYRVAMGREWEPLEYATHVEIPVDSDSTRADTRR
jgi:hypothetical protein